jgi:DNA-binding IscR family transcriptional regulator
MGLAGCTEETPCVLHEYWKSTLEEILVRLRSVTLADMSRHHDPGVERFRADHGLA